MIKKSVRCVMLSVLAWAPLRAEAQTHPEISNASADLRKILIAEQDSLAFSASQRLLTAIFAEIEKHPPVFERTTNLESTKPTASPAPHLADLCSLLSRLDASVSTGKLVIARDYALVLVSAVGETVQAKQPSPSAVQETKLQGLTPFQRYLSLPRAASAAFAAGDLAKADAYASELLVENEAYRKPGGNGEGVFRGNLVKGRVEMTRGNLASASAYLLSAGRSTGSPALNTFGPNMTLARDLLLKGQSAAVLEYLDLCGAFWKDNRGLLDNWKAAIRSGQIPDFGPNLNY